LPMSKPSTGSTENADIGKRSPLFRWLWLPLAKAFARFLFLFFGPIRCRNSHKVPPRGGVLILSNHLADVDPIIVQVTCPRSIHFMAKSELFEVPVLRSFLRFFNAFPVKRGEPDRGSIKRAVQLLRQGEAVCVFPEGQLSEDGTLQELKPGIALLARMADCQVICCGLKNTNRIMPYGKLIPRPSWHFTWAHWGEPKSFGKGAEAEEIVSWAEKELRSLAGQPDPSR
jgi:1-acyl-sn-glycerol-3-phosphate acyltransferase